MLFLCIAEWLAAFLASTQYKLAASSTFDKQKCPQTWPNVSCGQNHPTLITTVLLEIFRLTSLRRKHKWSLYLEGSFSFYWNILYMKDYAFTWPISSWAFHKGKRKANILTILKIVIYSIKNSEDTYVFIQSLGNLWTGFVTAIFLWTPICYWSWVCILPPTPTPTFQADRD